MEGRCCVCASVCCVNLMKSRPGRIKVTRLEEKQTLVLLELNEACIVFGLFIFIFLQLHSILITVKHILCLDSHC